MIRKAVFAGTWYPEEPGALDCYVQTDGEGLYKGAVLPHAGLFYSAALISDFFKGIAPGIDHVVIISPSHYAPLEDGLFCYSGFTCSDTPYGQVETIPLPLGKRADWVAAREHGIEMFLPYIAKKGLKVSYLLLNTVSSYSRLEYLAEELSKRLSPSSALVASSDFTHYGPRFNYQPYGVHGALEHVVAHDREVAGLLAQGEVETVFRRYNNKTTICGLAPAMTAALALRGLEGRTGRHLSSSDGSGGEDFVDYFTVFWS